MCLHEGDVCRYCAAPYEYCDCLRCVVCGELAEERGRSELPRAPRTIACSTGCLLQVGKENPKENLFLSSNPDIPTGC